MLYVISFEVDNSVSFTNDSAIIVADNYSDAIRRLNKFINAIDSETCVSKIYSVDKFEGDVFTGKHGKS